MRNKLERINDISFKLLGFTIILFIFEFVRSLVTSNYNSITSIIIGMLFLTGFIWFISFIILEALPKSEAGEPTVEYVNALRSIEIVEMPVHKENPTTLNPGRKRARNLKHSMIHYFSPTVISLESKVVFGKVQKSFLLVLGRTYNYVEGVGTVEKPLEDRIIEVKEFIQYRLKDDEVFKYKGEAFIIEAPEYELRYYIEAYKKNPNRYGYFEMGIPVVKKIYGRGVAESFYDLKHKYGPHSDIVEKVFRDMNDDTNETLYTNARERFIALCWKYL